MYLFDSTPVVIMSLIYPPTISRHNAVTDDDIYDAPQAITRPNGSDNDEDDDI
jgi:hypothetical protein